VPLVSLDAAHRARLRADVWDRVGSASQLSELFMFTREVEHSGSTVHSRMFAPGLGITEDPATGGASGPLGCYLVHDGIVPGDGREIVSEQGIEMGRPSFLHMRIQRDGAQYTHVGVGGTCIYVGNGTIHLRD